MNTRLILISFLVLNLTIQAQETKPKNILFIIVDDLRTALPTYGNKEVVAPYITNFAESAVQFNNAYVNIPTCGASRASILTGIRPREYFKKFTTSIERDMPDAITFPGLLKSKGFTTISNGKISHNRDDMDFTWSEIWRPKGLYNNQDYVDRSSSDSLEVGGLGAVYPFENLDVPDLAYKDGKIAAKSIEDLQKTKNLRKTFFASCRFFKTSFAI